MTADRTDPQAAACLRLATHHHLRGRFERAAHWYRLAHELVGDDAEVLFNLAATSMRARQYPEAQAAFDALDKALADRSGADPLPYATRYNQILFEHRLFRKKDPSGEATSEARRLAIDLLTAVADSPPSEERKVLERLEGAATSLLAWLTAPADGADADVAPMSRDELRAMLERDERSSAALVAYARENYPDDATALYNLACCETARAGYDAAIEHLGGATKEPLLSHLVAEDARLADLRTERPEQVAELIDALAGKRWGIAPAVTGFIGIATGGLLKRSAKRVRPRETRSDVYAVIAPAITDVIDRILWPVTGSPRGNDPESLMPRPHALQGVFAAQGLAPLEPTEATAWDDVLQPRLSALLRGRSWPGIAAHSLDVLARRCRGSVDEWSASMREPEMTAVLTRLGDLAGRLADLSRGIGRRDAEVGDVVGLWATTLAEAISLREDLMRASGARAGGVPMFRTAVPEPYRNELSRRAAQAERNRAAALRVLRSPLPEPGAEQSRPRPGA